MKSQLTRDLFKKLYKQGRPLKEIQETLDISKRTALYWAREMKLPRRWRLNGTA